MPQKKQIPGLQQQPAKHKEKEIVSLVELFDAVGLSDFSDYIQSPSKIFWLNLYSGIAKGLGIVIGGTLVVGLLVWLLGSLSHFPIIGKYLYNISEIIETGAASQPIQ